MQKYRVKFRQLKGIKAFNLLILATDDHGETLINTDDFDKSNITQKSKCPSVRIRVNPWQKKLKMRIAVILAHHLTQPLKNSNIYYCNKNYYKIYYRGFYPGMLTRFLESPEAYLFS
jgi:hypothetical protein